MAIEAAKTSNELLMTHIETEIKTPVVYKVVKRVFDFLSSLCVGMILIIPILIIALIIMIKDFGNPFYIQKRLGKDGRELKIFKLRSMKKGADDIEKLLTPQQLEEYKKEYKLDDDPRLIGYKKPGDGNSCFGALLRRWSVDELPQIIFNICILGNMSVVGPRPILQEELEEHYTAEQQSMLLSVKPGLTGYWQAYARNNAGYTDGIRQEMELYYIKNKNFMLDMKIIFKTFETVIKRSGAK